MDTTDLHTQTAVLLLDSALDKELQMALELVDLEPDTVSQKRHVELEVAETERALEVHCLDCPTLKVQDDERRQWEPTVENIEPNSEEDHLEFCRDCRQKKAGS